MLRAAPMHRHHHHHCRRCHLQHILAASFVINCILWRHSSSPMASVWWYISRRRSLAARAWRQRPPIALPWHHHHLRHGRQEVKVWVMNSFVSAHSAKEENGRTFYHFGPWCKNLGHAVKTTVVGGKWRWWIRRRASTLFLWGEHALFILF